MEWKRDSEVGWGQRRLRGCGGRAHLQQEEMEQQRKWGKGDDASLLDDEQATRGSMSEEMRELLSDAG